MLLFFHRKKNYFLTSIKGLPSINYQSDDREHVADCVQQVSQQSFNYVDNLEALQIHVKIL